jgi:hypothetical protein
LEQPKPTWHLWIKKEIIDWRVVLWQQLQLLLFTKFPALLERIVMQDIFSHFYRLLVQR